jgi:hypothetical protein
MVVWCLFKSDSLEYDENNRYLSCIFKTPYEAYKYLVKQPKPEQYKLEDWSVWSET